MISRAFSLCRISSVRFNSHISSAVKMLPVSMDTITSQLKAANSSKHELPQTLSSPPQHVDKKLKIEGQDGKSTGGKLHHKKAKKYKLKKNAEPTSPLGVLAHEISELIAERNLKEEDILNPINDILNERIDRSVYHRQVDNVEVSKFTSNGDSLLLVPNPEDPTRSQVVVVPFAIPGDVVNVKIFKTHPTYVESDLLKIVTNSKDRDQDLIQCKYFGVCSGCQYQPMTYLKQLSLKKDVIANAYKFFAPKISDQTPPISETEPSPLQYSYRTKLTPHFDLPRRKPEDFQRPNLGFGAKVKQVWREDGALAQPRNQGESIIDIEECVIGTPIINKGIANERQKFESTFNNYKKGATILLRENTGFAKDAALEGEVELELDEESGLIKTYVTKPRQIVTEIINGIKFEFSAGEFFQNNNSILPRVIEYVSENLQLSNSEKENYLIDAYCGSGLFSISLLHSVTKSIGVEISADSVKFAKRNAELNNIKNCEFLLGKLELIFADIAIPHDQTSIILDPPRKGCDSVFLAQLSDFKPVKIIYISCNVHSQARDLEYFLTETENGKLYKLDTVKGFDFFPQTHHVESVAVLSLK